MRKIRRAAVCVLLVLALAACGGPGSREPEEPDVSPEDAANTEPVEPAEPTIPEEPVAPPEEEAVEVPPAEEPAPPVEAPPEAEAEPIAATEPANADSYSEEAYDQLVADVLDSITNSDMTKLEKAKAIFNYAKGKIRYTGDSDKSDWKKGAYTGLTAREGDCFTYYAVSRALLTAAEIDNLEVTRVGGPTSHYWNLVNCGDGWYHFDATPRSSKMPAFNSFMFTDKEAADYTARAGRSYYSFDGSLLPARAGSEDDQPVENTPPAENTAQPVEDAPPVEDTTPTEDTPTEDTPPAEDTPPEGTEEPAESSDPEPVLPEDELPADAAEPEPEPEPDAPVEIMEMPDWLKPVGSDDEEN